MKKILIGITFILVLGGCGFLEDVNNSLDYTKEATEHINTLTDFAKEAPQMIEDAANDPAAKEQLESHLNTLQEEIEGFNTVDAPAMVEDIHNNLVNKNEEILNEINKLVEDGQLTIEKIENAEIFQTINEVQDLMKQIEDLGL
ncbi:DUF6376 family protein [Aquibacillus koreensis]|uniref:DUF6376 family protein n=1 Tax=Aquibacillus koreensis TaxID=279446 RepID=A0A9X3WSK7_9BACI|nr:DUF6376 family protein [Aquibacillus koreensis]MCT2534192.1 DUF6376 family protein [Aquibacillus koreensis]MDC3422584.1 DUF6376 family protein [Aquibacillus koreensis]